MIKKLQEFLTAIKMNISELQALCSPKVPVLGEMEYIKICFLNNFNLINSCIHIL